jgi:hypothetical protein
VLLQRFSESKSSENTKVLTDFAAKLREQGESSKQFANAIQTDINKDKSALDLVRSANVKLQTLLDSAENQVDAAKRVIVTGEKLDATYVEQNIVDVKSAIVAIIDATKTSAELAADKIKSPSAKVTEKVKVEDKMAKSTGEKVADVPPAKEVVPESKAESEPAEENPAATPEQKEEPKEDATVKLENKSTEGSKEISASKSESQADIKAADTTEDTQPVKSEPNTIDSKKEVEVTPKANNEPKPNSAEAKKEETPEHDESRDVKNTNDAPKDTPNETPKEEKSQANEENSSVKSENDHGESSKEGKHLLNEMESSNASDSNTAAATPEKSVAEISDSKTTITLADKPNLESHVDVITDAHAASEPSNLLSAAPLDVGDLHPSTSDAGHELANVVSNAAEVVQDLASVITASLF